MHRVRELARTPGQRLLRRVSWGGALIVVGVVTLIKGVDALHARDLWLLAPALLAWTALMRLTLDRNAASVMRGTLQIAVAAWLVLCIEGVGGASFADQWPIALMGLGVATVASGLVARAPAADTEPT